MQTICINDNDAGQRLDSFMKKIMPRANAGLIYRYIRTNKVKLNAKKPKPDVRLTAGDVITYYGDSALLQARTFTRSEYAIDVVYEDENIVVINKPAGIACQPDSLRTQGTLADSLKTYLFDRGEYNPENEQSFSPALCNRIDFNTSGLCIGAKNAKSLRLINRKLREREIRRFYCCVTNGLPPHESGTVKTQVIKNKEENKSYIVDSGGKEALTHYRVIKKAQGKALVELEIVSGRTHQIRLHMASLGCPVEGDSKYGEGGRAQKLTAHKIVFAFLEDAGELAYLKDKVIEIPVSFKV